MNQVIQLRSEFVNIIQINIIIWIMKKNQEQTQSLSEQDVPQKQQRKSVRHLYLEQENIYGRFIPYLLLKDQIDNQVDSSGYTALHHMCSNNSPFIPLYLSTIKNNDPILNLKSKMGHTPLDVAGMYCSKQTVDLLKQKGAIDTGNVDHWAIQGANIANWSGKIYPEKKFLVNWAAYNDLPEVLTEYGRQGVVLSEQDSNGYSPIDLTIINKSYKSMRVLAELGERPQYDLIKSTDSKAIKHYFAILDQSDTKKMMKKLVKFLTLPLFLIIALYLSQSQYALYFAGLTIFTMIYLMVRKTPPEKYMNQERKTAFQSQLLFNKQINRRNQISYMFMHIFLITTLGTAMVSCQIKSYLEAMLFWILLFALLAYLAHLGIQFYGIFSNLTYSEIFQAHKWSHLWNLVEYVPERKMVVRKYENRYDQGFWRNICNYYHLGDV